MNRFASYHLLFFRFHMLDNSRPSDQREAEGVIKDGRGVSGGCGVWVWSKDSTKSVLFEPMRKVELPTTTVYCRYLLSLLRSVGHFTVGVPCCMKRVHCVLLYIFMETRWTSFRL